MEILDVLNKDGIKTGKTVVRGNKLPNGEYILVVHIWIRNSKGEYLITKRSPNKKILPNMWETTVGAVISGEDSRDAALREVSEEIGITISKDSIKYINRYKVNNDEVHYLIDAWFTECDIEITDLKLQQEEVVDAKWVNEDTIKKMINSLEFANTFCYIEDIFSFI